MVFTYFGRLSRVKMVFTVFSKDQPIRVLHFLRLECSASSMLFTMFSKLRAGKSMVFIVFSKAQPSKAGTYCFLEGSADQTMVFTVFSKARPNKSIVFTYF